MTLPRFTGAWRTGRCSGHDRQGRRHGQEMLGLRGHPTAPSWQPGAGGLCLHTVIADPDDPVWIFVAISAAGVFRSDDSGRDLVARKTRTAVRRGPSRSRCRCRATASTASPSTRQLPDVLFMQRHWDVMRSDDAGNSWYDIGEDLPSDFGFCIDVHAHEPEMVYIVPISELSCSITPPKASCASTPVVPGATSGSSSTEGPAPRRLLRERVPRRHVSGHAGTACTWHYRGQVYASADAGDSWAAGAGPTRRPFGGGPDPAVTQAPAPQSNYSSRRWPLPRCGCASRRSRECWPGSKGRCSYGPRACHPARCTGRPGRQLPGADGDCPGPVIAKRRPFIRFFVGEEDLSNQAPDERSPPAVVAGTEPFVVWGPWPAVSALPQPVWQWSRGV